ncbi:MAG: plastocyanin/azurin family copper-binding protein [Nitrosopumilus sp.]|nr:plastocyanin/azurin family copper-binding protein [Nitrosopumilus sp.]MDH3794591.1 plastocyanin/azurin family copper-binding protein [Nitrosopumilus sp.]MDH3854745.1 plastocyanin/azurin family copper-binding protein [Nitrosopumilus sp.]
MKHVSMKILIPAIVFSILLISSSTNFVSAESIPEWVKNNALWYGQGNISETEFLNMIKFLLESEVIKLESVEKIVPEVRDATVIIPNGNFDVSSSAFYMPLNLEISAGTTVTWTNDDSVPHTVQSQDEYGNVIALFNSAPLNTGDKFEYTFEEAEVYNYFCSFHPWRVGVVTVK